MIRSLIKIAGACAVGLYASTPAFSADAPSQTPIFLTGSAQPAVLINLGRDHKLYYEAYNDISDVNGDGIVDVRYTPADYSFTDATGTRTIKGIDYYGLFDSYKCYVYTNSRFEPSRSTSNKQCTGEWSGDFLNYLTTTRIDALRRVLYGGKRSVDTATETVLERNYIPQDAHSFGKEYTNFLLPATTTSPILPARYSPVEANGYDITKYTPLQMPAQGQNILFASVTRLKTDITKPLLRVMTGKSHRLWEWLSIERPVAEQQIATGNNNRQNVGDNVVDYIVRAKVCVTGMLEPDCRAYNNPTTNATVYKPTGVLHEFGEKDQMRFGLITGSYDKSFAGGMLRKNISDFSNEIEATTGRFIGSGGIVKTIDALRVQSFSPSENYQYDCGWPGGGGGDCVDWGNPIAEMMYEGLRYLSGKTSPTSAFDSGSGTTPGSKDASLGLKRVPWIDPFGANGLPRCSKPVQMVFSDVYPSADGDEIPGGFGGASGDLAGFNAADFANAISAVELIPGNYFIGESGSVVDNAPTAKAVTGFGNIRGLAPDEPSRGGTYFSAAVALFGKTNDIRGDLNGTQNVDTYSIALTSPSPRIEIPVASTGGIITLVPMGRTVGSGSGTLGAPNKLAIPIPNGIVDFYIEKIRNQPGFPTDALENDGRPYGKFRINFEDVDQGADHDMDAIAIYEYKLLANNTLEVKVTSDFAAGGYIQHLGYVISGTTTDGPLLVVRDSDTDAADAAKVDYGLTTTPPAGFTVNGVKVGLPLNSTMVFTPSTNSANSARYIPKGPLWYAAKWGGFPDLRNSDNEIKLLSGMGIPAAGSAEKTPGKWDNRKTGEPDNYFLVSNASQLREQIRNAFRDILNKAGAAAGIANGSVGLSADSWSYVGQFDSSLWFGRVTGSKINTLGVTDAPTWDTHTTFAYPNTTWQSRTVLTWTPSSSPTAAPADGIAGFFNHAGTGAIPASQYTELQLNKLFPTLQPIPSLNWSGLADDDARNAKTIEVLTKYIKGDRSLEKYDVNGQPIVGGNLRDRKYLLGDIVNSNIAAAGNFNYGFRSLGGTEGTSYGAWLTSKRTNGANYRTVYVGANDGMLHAINALTGEERFAFVPNAVYPKLYKLLESGKSHEYTVDGKIAISDAYRNAWTTVVVGSTGAGGRSVFALDVGSPTGQTSNVLWEFKSPGLGYPLGKPIIGRTPDSVNAQGARTASGRWVAVFSNGYFSTGGKATLFVVDLFTGAVLKSFEFENANGSNGLGAPGPFVEDGVLKAVFAGDSLGNLWGVNFASADVSEWKAVGNTLPVFKAKSSSGANQPIMAAPSVSPFIGGGVQVFFGTGKLVEDDDRDSATRNSFYALQVNDLANWSGNVQRGSLLPTTLTQSGDLRYLSKITFTGAQKGWYFDLPTTLAGQGAERFISEPKFGLGYVDVNTWQPLEDRCAVGGASWGMTMNALTGSNGEAQFDVNKDGYVDPTEGKSGGVFAAGTKLSGGTVSAPAINLTQGNATGAATATIVGTAANCPAGQTATTVAGSPTKICRPPAPTKGCPANSKMVTNSAAESTQASVRCIPINAGRQTWSQLR
jgi:type IV pilus assembly protein PilY1